MPDLMFLLGLSGSITASILFFPQVWASYRTKRTKDLSWAVILIGIINGAIWTVYGLLKADMFIYATNSMIVIATSMLLMLKRKYG
ncbi:MAG: PQ-loop repeat-containing protein [Candidatus Aenigmarchaeota archaeon]|nr:PQ-loop repeat-containing protein [Candidatus Aenigmarchaeota archaeon]